MDFARSPRVLDRDHAFAGTWLTADSYRGTLTNPRSQNRYGFVEGNPATFVDAYGFRLSDPGAYAPKVIKSTTYQRTADGWDRYLTKNPNVQVNNGPPGSRDSKCYTPKCSSSHSVSDRHPPQTRRTTWDDTDEEPLKITDCKGGCTIAVPNRYNENQQNGSNWLGLAIGLAMGGECDTFVNDVLLCSGAGSMPKGSALTIGNRTVWNGTPQDYVNSGLFTHETVHTDQMAEGGLLNFGVPYLEEGMASCDNHFESDTGVVTPGYDHCWWGTHPLLGSW